jgi:hypothetical protein
VSEPVNLRIVRPYASEDEFLAGDLWTLDAKGALLVNQSALDPGTLVRFDVVLSTGERVIRAEGKVVKYVEPTATRPGGLRVRFTRFGGSTKAFIDRAVELRRAAAATRPEPASNASPARAPSAPPAAPPAPAPSAPPAPASAPVAREPSIPAPARAAPSGPTPKPELRSGVTASAEPLALPARAAGADFGERRQVLRERAVQHVAAPANRDALLDRLRSRVRK